jgi:ferredoxin, 2Fe-2S
MPSLIVADRSGNVSTITAEPGLSLMEILRGQGFDELLALCGGCCSCATCHVQVDPAFASALPPMKRHEDDLLQAAPHRQENSRLSCQIVFTPDMDGMRVAIASED